VGEQLSVLVTQRCLPSDVASSGGKLIVSFVLVVPRILFSLFQGQRSLTYTVSIRYHHALMFLLAVAVSLFGESFDCNKPSWLFAHLGRPAVRRLHFDFLQHDFDLPAINHL